MRIDVSQKQRTNNKTEHEVRSERDRGRAELLNYSKKHKVQMFWDMNPSTKEDGMFILKVGDKEAMINAEEMRRFLRWV